jgi:hypothetical protein
MVFRYYGSVRTLAILYRHSGLTALDHLQPSLDLSSVQAAPVRTPTMACSRQVVVPGLITFYAYDLPISAWISRAIEGRDSHLGSGMR